MRVVNLFIGGTSVQRYMRRGLRLMKRELQPMQSGLDSMKRMGEQTNSLGLPQVFSATFSIRAIFFSRSSTPHSFYSLHCFDFYFLVWILLLLILELSLPLFARRQKKQSESSAMVRKNQPKNYYLYRFHDIWYLAFPRFYWRCCRWFFLLLSIVSNSTVVYRTNTRNSTCILQLCTHNRREDKWHKYVLNTLVCSLTI